MIESISCSSLSSFEDFNGYQYQINNHQTKAKYQNKLFEKRPKLEQQSCQFSQFDDLLGETLQAKLNLIRRQDKMQQMRRQLQQLKQDNYHLSNKNQLLQKQIEKFKQDKRTLELGKNQQQEQLQQQQHQKSWRKGKIQTLLKELQRVKQSINKLRRQSEKDKSTIYSLKQQLTILSDEKRQWAWKQKFIILFIDMTKKISEGFDDNWSDKKKIQVGWKVVKSLMHRVFENGIKPPKIKTSQL